MPVSNKELLDISVNMEQEAQAFYQDLASHISEPIVKNYLLLMAKDEAHHENQFKNILEGKEHYKFGWEDCTALREMIDTRLKPGHLPKFEDLYEDLPGFESIQKALNFALIFEELAVEFYGAMREYCEDLETEVVLVVMESEEKSHRDYIQALIDHWDKSAR